MLFVICRFLLSVQKDIYFRNSIIVCQDEAGYFVRPQLGIYSFQKLAADDENFVTSRQRTNTTTAIHKWALSRENPIL